MARVRCMLVIHDGPSRRVGSNGVLIGRQADCDLVSLDPQMSRRHALVRVTSDGAEVVPLGKGAVEINGKPTDRPQLLADGDRLGFPGLELGVEIEAGDDAATAFVIEREGGGRFGIAHSPFRIGGGASDDLVIDGWERAALVFHLAQGELLVEQRGDDGLRPVAIGERVTCNGETFAIASADAAATTAAAGDAELPTAVTIELLPRGGLVVFALASGTHQAFLADKRFDLLMALLQPPAGHQPGDFIADDVVRAIVWPRNDGAGRTEINVLISRCRRDLVEAGLNGPRLIQRAPGGGGTRFVLARGATVTVKR